MLIIKQELIMVDRKPEELLDSDAFELRRMMR